MKEHQEEERNDSLASESLCQLCTPKKQIALVSVTGTATSPVKFPSTDCKSL